MIHHCGQAQNRSTGPCRSRAGTELQPLARDFELLFEQLICHNSRLVAISLDWLLHLLELLIEPKRLISQLGSPEFQCHFLDARQRFESRLAAVECFGQSDRPQRRKPLGASLFWGLLSSLRCQLLADAQNALTAPEVDPIKQSSRLSIALADDLTQRV